MFDCVILDIDGTVYDYEKNHLLSLNLLIKKIVELYGVNYEYVDELYKKESKKIKTQLGSVASSHSKTIYIKNILIELKVGLSDTLELIDYYWRCFFENMELYDGVFDFLVFCKKRRIPIIFLTDYTLKEQLLKLKKLKILDFAYDVISSEEVGREKPSPQIYQHLFFKFKNYHKFLMVGDNIDKDVFGATENGIFPIWINKKYETHDHFLEFKSFRQFSDWFLRVMEHCEEFISLSKMFGERQDLVQGAGGNISIKIDNLMIIKSSGFNMSDISKNKGISILNNKKLTKNIEKKKPINSKDYVFVFEDKPSMEFTMHSILSKYVIHLHPVEIIKKISKKDVVGKMMNYPILEYVNPGIDLTEEIKNNKKEKVFFLKNHGIIIHDDNIENLLKKTQEILLKFNEEESLDYVKFELVNYISKKLNKKFNRKFVTSLCEDEFIKKSLNKNIVIRHFFPDSFVYCGKKVFSVDEIDDLQDSEVKILTDGLNIYFHSESYLKNKKIEEVLKANLMIEIDSSVSCLEDQNLTFLFNSEDEKYRKKIC